MTNAGPDQCGYVRRWLGHGITTAKELPMDDLNSFLEPGQLVRHPGAPQWGVGQVQSNISGKVTVNFREAGKVVINGFHIGLVVVMESYD